jgi:hypothetical protein
MAKYVGMIRRTDVEGGAWTLVSDQGVVYQLAGGGKDLLVDGIRAEIDGTLATAKMGIAMLGDNLEVKSYRVLG